MKILGSDIRVGNIIEYKNDLWKCLKNQTSNRGNLRSHNQVELKSITKGTKLNERFRADETVEKASLEEKKFQFLYSANDEFFFMDSENFEQISINKTLVENCEKLLKENLEVIIEYKNDLWKCLKNQTSNRGNLRSHNQVELKSITKGTKLNERFRADETVEKASLEEKKFQFLYSANDEFFFMDSENFEQISINKTLVENCEKLLKENLEVTIEFYQEKPLSVILPRSVEYEILETDSVVRGQTASSSFKPATIQNGVKIMVPPFIDQGDKIIVDTETQEYLKKVS